METKYLLFIFAVFVIVPVGILIARKNSRILNLVFIALIFGTTQPETLFGLPTDINFMSREWYRGTTRGIEISYLDLLAIILFFGSKSARFRENIDSYKLPSFGLLKAYLIWALVTVILFSEPKIFGVFEISKIMRAMLIFLVVAAFIRSPEQLKLFVYVLIGIVFYEASVALHDRYILGIHRIRATLPHPNSLSMYSLQIFPILFSISFAKDISLRLRQLCLLSSLLIAGIIILTISRTGFASLILLSFFTLIFNIRKQMTARNLGFLLLVLLIGVGMLVKSWDSISSRFAGFSIEKEYIQEGGDRGSYFRKAWPAFVDNPVAGVGLNNWSYWITQYSYEAGYYDKNPYPSLDYPPSYGYQEPPAHNLYLITAVELGFVGLVILIALFSRWLQLSFSAIRNPGDSLTDRFRIGAFMSLLGVLMQSVTEWEFRQTPMFFLGHAIMSASAYLYYINHKALKKSEKSDHY